MFNTAAVTIFKHSLQLACDGLEPIVNLLANDEWQ